MEPRDKLQEYYVLVENRDNESIEQEERRWNLFLELKDMYEQFPDIDNNCIFDVEEGAYQHYGYALYSEENMLLYVGIAADPKSRWRQHFHTKRAAYMKVVAGGPTHAIKQWEKETIQRYLPPLNKMLVTDEGGWTNCWNLIDRVDERYRDIKPPDEWLYNLDN